MGRGGFGTCETVAGGGAGGGSHKSGQSATGTPVVGKSGGKGIVVIRYKFQ